MSKLKAESRKAHHPAAPVLTDAPRIRGAKRQLTATDYEAIFKLTPDMICVADRQGILLDVSPACHHILGFSPEEIIGKSWKTYVHPDDVESTMQQIAAQLCGHHVVNFVNRYRRKAGGYSTLQWQASFTSSEILVGTARDISEQVRHAELLATLAQNERKSVRFALHDGIGQQLFGLRMLASQLERTLQGTREDLAVTARNMEQIARETLDAVRNIMDGLIPFDDRPDGFAEALQGLADRVQTLHGAECSLAITGAIRDIHHDLAIQLFLIAQAAVMNAVKHAAPTRIALEISRSNHHLALVVTDDGHRLSKPEDTAGLGLEIMRHRAALIGATLDIATGETEGTVVQCDLDIVG